MELDELKKTLISIGVPERLTKMPAVMERLKRLLTDCRSEREIREQLSIGEDGVIKVLENPFERPYGKDIVIMKIAEKEDGARIDIHGPYDFDEEYATNIDVDELGFDKLYKSYGDDGNYHLTISRENGIIVSDPFDVYNGGHPSRFADNGEPCLASSLEKVKRKRSLEENMEYYVARYPETMPFFNKLKSIEEERKAGKPKEGDAR